MSTAAQQQLVACLRCTRTWPTNTPACGLCGKPLHPRKRHSVQATWAYLITAVLCYFPANFLPIMHTTRLGRVQDNTILGGVVVLWDLGAYPTALVIFIASVLIPITKIFALGWLAWSVRHFDAVPAARHNLLFTTVELVGSWSMVDVFVVALLVALVRFSGVLTIAPGSAALAFCGMVIFTMLAARAFDPRLLWDKAKQ